MPKCRIAGPAVIIALFVLSLTPALADENGLVTLPSNYSVAETMDKLEAALNSKGMTVFTRVDHAAGAANAELSLRPTQLLVFGNPKVGTPLMNCSQSTAIDLPQKALAWEDEAGKVWLSYNDPQYLNQRHGLSECAPVLEKVSAALANFAKAATE